MSYRRQQAILEDLNYYNDRRVRATQDLPWMQTINEQTMTISIVAEWYDDDCNEQERSFTLPGCYTVCPTCEGRGSHVNPSIDCGGITSNDWDEDPDFEEEYRGGRYDVACYGCKGQRVIMAIAESQCFTDEQKENLALLARLQEEAEEDHRERMMEMRYGW